MPLLVLVPIYGKEVCRLMEIERQAQIVNNIHDTLNTFVGQRLSVRANMGRSKIVEAEGTLVQVHPQLFIMEVDRKRGRTARQSYQYVDVLTGTVELSKDGESLFSPLIEELTQENESTVSAPAMTSVDAE